MDVLVTGASGLIGTALRPALVAAGHRPIALVRRPVAGADEISWDPATGRLDRASIEGAGAAIHLAGVGIGDKRWTEEQKRVLRESRVQTTGLLARAIAALREPPPILVSASAIGYYGDRGDEILTEKSGPGEGFLTELCEAWEAATAPAEQAGTVVTHIRSGIVLTPKGGALAKLLPIFRFGVGGRFGSGSQWQSWISIDDEVAAILHLLTTPLSGPVNLTAPNPVRNRELADHVGSCAPPARRAARAEVRPRAARRERARRQSAVLQPTGAPRPARRIGFRVRPSLSRGGAGEHAQHT